MAVMRRLAGQAVVRGHSGTLSSCEETWQVQGNGLRERLLGEKHKHAIFCVRWGGTWYKYIYELFIVAERNTGRINKRTPTKQTNNKNDCLREKE